MPDGEVRIYVREYGNVWERVVMRYGSMEDDKDGRNGNACQSCHEKWEDGIMETIKKQGCGRERKEREEQGSKS